jgi:hypothetical protein
MISFPPLRIENRSPVTFRKLPPITRSAWPLLTVRVPPSNFASGPVAVSLAFAVRLRASAAVVSFRRYFASSPVIAR